MDTEMKTNKSKSMQDYCMEYHMEYLLDEWDKEKNGSLTPKDITAGSGEKVWWVLHYDDPCTRKHFDFSWKSEVRSRINGIGCPYLSGQAVWEGFNDLKSTHPELAAQWHPSKNGNLKPEDVTDGSNYKAWWFLSYDDEKSGKHFDFEWKSSIASRTKGIGCPYISGKAVWKGFNDLETVNTKLAAEWDYKKNKMLPSEVTAGSRKKVWWKCSICGHKWKTAISRRNICGCPECRKKLRSSIPEQTVGFYLKKYFPDAESRNREVLNMKELDIYIPSISAAVEYDGQQFHQDIKRDINKNRLCAEKKSCLSASVKMAARL